MKLHAPRKSSFRLGQIGRLNLLAVAMAASAWFASPAAQAQWLVTPEEAQASQAAPQALSPRTAPVVTPGAPRVNLLAPNVSNTVPSPTRIQVRFEATAPASIKPDTFKVRYGAFKLDITGRITAASKVTAEGIDVAEAALPKGSHRLFIEIQDSMGRVGERVVGFVVE
jgi:hypothetical protein